jgi:cation diffusion facilitator family transporter
MPSGSVDAARSGVRRVLWLTLALNVAVSLAKILVGNLSRSMSMVADGYHSLLDGANNVVGLLLTQAAYAPPDEDHPYGHRKFETAATVTIGLALLGLAYRVLADALVRAETERLPDIGVLSWTVMAVTLVVNFVVATYEAREGQRLGSPYLTADSAHTKSDIYVTLGVIASFAGARAGLPWTDSAVAAGIGGFIGVLGVRILVGAFHTLTDRAAIPSRDLERLVLGVPGVQGCRDIRTRGGPDAVHVDLVAHVDGEMTLRAAHAVADRIEQAIHDAHPGIVDVIVHVEPAGG